MVTLPLSFLLVFSLSNWRWIPSRNASVRLAPGRQKDDVDDFGDDNDDGFDDGRDGDGRDGDGRDDDGRDDDGRDDDGKDDDGKDDALDDDDNGVETEATAGEEAKLAIVDEREEAEDGKAFSFVTCSPFSSSLWSSCEDGGESEGNSERPSSPPSSPPRTILSPLFLSSSSSIPPPFGPFLCALSPLSWSLSFFPFPSVGLHRMGWTGLSR